MRDILKDIAFFFINSILNKIPSRTIRINLYHILSKRKISKKASIGLGVKFLDIRNIVIGDRTNINFNCIIDGRGDGIIISNDVDIAPQVNIWSLEHDPSSTTHEARSRQVKIESNTWIANRAIILPGSILESGVIIGAGAVVKGVVKKNQIKVGNPSQNLKLRPHTPNFKLRSIRPFR